MFGRGKGIEKEFWFWGFVVGVLVELVVVVCSFL